MNDEPITVVLHPALREPFEEWLESRRLRLAQIPDDPDDAYIVTPTKELWDEMIKEQKPDQGQSPEDPLQAP